jgi:hypothetical protein
VSEEHDLASLVGRAAELRKQLAGRLPHTVSFKFLTFVAGTAGFTWEERGIYLGLLYRQFDKGHVPNDMQQLAALTNTTPDEFGALWRAKLSEKFIEHAGSFYNATMLREWIAQAEYLVRERSRSRGRKVSQSQGPEL